MTNENDFAEYRRLILQQIEDIVLDAKDSRKAIADIEKKIAIIETKLIIASAIVSALVTLAIKFLK